MASVLEVKKHFENEMSTASEVVIKRSSEKEF